MLMCVSLLLHPLICFVGCQCQVWVLVKAIAPLTAQQVSANRDVFCKIALTVESPIPHFAPMWTYNIPHY